MPTFYPRILLELDIAPFEWYQQMGNSDIPTYTLSHYFDVVAGASYMKNAKNHRSHFDMKKINITEEHSIKYFKTETIDVLEEIMLEINKGTISLY